MILAILDADLAAPRSHEMLTAPVLGQPMIWRALERLRQARTLTKVVVATRRDTANDALSGYLISRGMPVFRGEPDDLLGGYARCARTMGEPSHVVVVSGDTPLIDPGVVDEAVRFSLATRAAFVANNGPSTYPKGLEVGVVRVDALAAAAEDAGPAERGSISAFIQGRPDRFETAYFRARRDWSAFDWRADTARGYALACAVFAALHAADPAFGHEAALDYIDGRPDLAQGRRVHAA